MIVGRKLWFKVKKFLVLRLKTLIHELFFEASTTEKWSIFIFLKIIIYVGQAVMG